MSSKKVVPVCIPSQSEARAAVQTLIAFMGDDPNREGLRETPERVIRAWANEWGAGYGVDDAEVPAVLKVFEDGAQATDEMIVVRNIEIYSHCEHHMAPFMGFAHIGYIPNQEEPRIVGLSKLARLADIYARRLQVQERLTAQIADALVLALSPLGAGVAITAKHTCMCSRGVGKQHSDTVTSALRGAFRTDPSVRAEFLALTRGPGA